MLRYITCFAKTLFLSLLSTAQSYIHILYEKLLPPKEKTPSEQINILIVQLGQLGDFVLSIPFFGALKAAYGNRLRLVIITDQINKDIAEKDQNINATIIYNSPKNLIVNRPTQSLKFPLSALKKEIIDKAYWIRGDWRTFIWLVSNRIPMVSISKFSNQIRWSWWALIKGSKVKRDFKHYVENLGNLDKKAKVDLYIKENSIRNTIQNGKMVFVHIGAGHPLRRWPEEYFSELCRQLLEYNSDIEISLLGSKTEREIADRIKHNDLLSLHKDRIVNVCGKFDLSYLSEILRGGALYIGVDSGPMHIAASSGIPMTVLMGPGDPQIFRPCRTNGVRIIYKDYFCSPCWQFECLHADSGPGACLLAIQPEEVFREAKLFLGRKGMDE